MILHEQINRRSIVASVIGLIGAGVVIGGRLSGDYNFQMGQGILAILCSAVLYAYNLILQRQQALVAAPIEIGFFQNLTVILVFGALAPILAVVPPPAIAPQLFTASILGLFSMLMMSGPMQGRRQVPYFRWSTRHLPGLPCSAGFFL